MRLTGRGKAVVALAFLTAFVIGLTTADLCWDGSGYSTCPAYQAK